MATLPRFKPSQPEKIFGRNFNLRRDALFASRQRVRCFSSERRMRWYDFLAIFLAVGLLFEIAAEIYLAFFHPEDHLLEDVRLVHNVDLLLDLVFIGIWLWFVILHFRYNAEDFIRSLLVVFLPILYTPFYYFLHLRPELKRQLREANPCPTEKSSNKNEEHFYFW